jgi:hypothetical protein
LKPRNQSNCQKELTFDWLKEDSLPIFIGTAVFAKQALLILLVNFFRQDALLSFPQLPYY